jgi:hypothetical protein
VPVREAKPGASDRDSFRRLQLASLQEEYATGSHVLPTGQSLQWWLDLYQSYVHGSLYGVCLLWAPPDVLLPGGFALVGEGWEPESRDTTTGRTATLWSHYVEPSLRGGAGTELGQAAWRWARESGFDSGSFYIREQGCNHALAKRFGAVPRGVWYTVDLRAPRPEE